eukprot:1771615-Alexandrium_andersonii.AAC.1
MRAGLPRRGIKRRSACRKRIEARLRAGNDPRITAADERFYNCIVAAEGDPTLRAPAEEGQGGQAAGASSAGSGAGGRHGGNSGSPGDGAFFGRRRGLRAIATEGA